MSESIKEAELATRRRLGDAQQNILAVQGNLANTYEALGRVDEGLRLRQDAYSGTLKLLGAQHKETLSEANNYADILITLGRFEEAKTLMRKTTPVARRAHGESHEITLRMRWTYADALYKDPGATLDDLREVVANLEEIERTMRRVLGNAHPHVRQIVAFLRDAQAALRAHEA